MLYEMKINHIRRLGNFFPTFFASRNKKQMCDQGLLANASYDKV
jgi:hypothetical protein